MHSLLRQFAADKLADRKTAVDRAFVDYFYQFANKYQADYAELQPEWRNFLAGISKAHALAAWQTVLDFVQVLDEPWFRQIRFNDMREGLALALDAAKNLQDQPALARTLLRLGEIETELNNYAPAEAHLAQAMQLLMHLEESLGIAQANYLYGRIQMEQAKDDNALRLFEESRRIFTEEKDWLGVARNLNLIALCHMKQNPDFHTAQKNLEQSVMIQKQLPPSPIYVEGLRYLARIKGAFGDFHSAENDLIEAANVSRKLQDIGEYAAVLFDRTVLCKRQNQVDAGLQYGYECLNSVQQLGSLRWEGLIKTQLAILHQSQQNHQQALLLLCDGLQIFVELGDLYEQAYAHYYLFKLHNKMGEISQSEQAKQQAVQLNESLNDPQLRAVLEEA
jgi:tetratricopeptide (TPR) repeat protein